LENRGGKDNKMSRRMWKAMKTCTEKVRVGEVKERRSEERSRKEERRKRQKEEDSRSEESGRRMGNME